MGQKAQAVAHVADRTGMSATSVRIRTLVMAVVLCGSACSSQEPVADELSRDDVVLAYVDDGLDEATADCLVGLGARDLDLGTLLPGAASDNDALLIDEMLRSCQDALASLGEVDLADRSSFDVGPFNVGDDDYLDELWTGCSNGNGADCDRLWEEAPVGSIYESFGVTCGNRPEILDCTEEMNGPDRTPDSAG